MLEAAGHTAIARDAIAGLAKRLAEEPEPGALVAEALDADLDDAALALILAASVSGRPCEARLTERLLCRSQFLDDVALIVAATAGDRLATLLEAADTGGLEWERQAVLLYLAAELAGDTPPDRLIAQLRRLARRALQPQEGIYVGLAAQRIGDPDLVEAAAPWIQLARDPGLRADVEQLALPLQKPLLEVLPEEAPPRTVSGFTVRRAAEKVGRNEPCPCGSGKKYKKCCERKDRERLADPSPVPGVTMQEYLERPHDFLSPEEIGQLQTHELARLPLGELPTAHLEEATRTLILDWAWDDVERALGALASHQDTARPVDEYRALAAVEAWRAQERDVVRRHLDRIAEEPYRSDAGVLRALLDPSETTLARLDDEATRALREEPWRGIELAVQLLADYPALGILVGRGALEPELPDETEFLLEAIEQARDRLRLAPGDPASDMIRGLIYGEGLEPATGEETEELRDRLEKAKRRADALERELLVKQRTLEEQARERRAAAPEPAKGESREEAAEAELLRAKISHLKSLISDSKEERRRLKDELESLSRRAEERAAADQASSKAPEPEESGASEPAATEEAPAFRRPLIPQLGPRARDAVASADPKLARRAMQVVFDLALGQRRSAAQVKRLERVGDLWSARVGIHHRLLFRFDEGAGALEVVDLIEREELRTRLKKLS